MKNSELVQIFPEGDEPTGYIFKFWVSSGHSDPIAVARAEVQANRRGRIALAIIVPAILLSGILMALGNRATMLTATAFLTVALLALVLLSFHGQRWGVSLVQRDSESEFGTLAEQFAEWSDHSVYVTCAMDKEPAQVEADKVLTRRAYAVSLENPASLKRGDTRYDRCRIALSALGVVKGSYERHFVPARTILKFRSKKKGG